MEKQLAFWIYWEEDNEFYCSECIEKRLEEIDSSGEYKDDLGDDPCGYHHDYADVDYEVFCNCGQPLYSMADV